jgi:hypothetical protein
VISEEAFMSRTDRVRRPLGLTIAIVATAIFYGLLPLSFLYFLWRVDATAKEVFIMGGVDIPTLIWLGGVFGGATLIICLMAWLGRPSWIRFVLVGCILPQTVFYLYWTVRAMTTPEDPVSGGLVQSTTRGFLSSCIGPGIIMVLPYVLWYVNRAPARAFYRRVPLSSLASNRDSEQHG